MTIKIGMYWRWMILILIAVFYSSSLSAQRFAIKTNALTWATLSPNLGVELVVAEKVTLNLSTTFNPFKIKDYKLHFVQVQPEIKYWFGRPLAEHYLGVTGFFANNNMQFNDSYYKGDAYAVGLTYGYAWVLSNRWSMEASLGFGVIHYRQFHRLKDETYPTMPNKTGNKVAPVKIGLSFYYILK